MDYILEELERQRLAMELLLATPVKEATGNTEWEPNEERRIGFGPEAGNAWEASAAERRSSAAVGENTRAASAELQMAKEQRVLSAAQGGGRQLRSGETTLRLSAQEVSRAVERDARRYDGGYRAY